MGIVVCASLWLWSCVTRNRSARKRSSLLFPTLIEMAEDRQQTTKESKGIRNRLKKTIGFGSPQSRSESNVPSTLVAPPVAAAPTAAPTIIDPQEAAKLRAKYTRFRILVIGRANAGKTTLLKRVCNTTEEPSIYDKDKHLVSYRLILGLLLYPTLIVSSSTARTDLEGAGSVISASTLD
jgi:hypothetical protein